MTLENTQKEQLPCFLPMVESLPSCSFCREEHCLSSRLKRHIITCPWRDAPNDYTEVTTWILNIYTFLSKIYSFPCNNTTV